MIAASGKDAFESAKVLEMNVADGRCGFHGR
jgi:hypothetical protein